MGSEVQGKQPNKTLSGMQIIDLIPRAKNDLQSRRSFLLFTSWAAFYQNSNGWRGFGLCPLFWSTSEGFGRKVNEKQA